MRSLTLASVAVCLVRAVRAKGGHHVVAEHVATNHAWSDRRIKLESDVIAWLKKLR
jgi:hypothetical protein